MARKRKGGAAAVAAPPKVDADTVSEQFDRIDLAAVAWANMVRIWTRNLFNVVDSVNALEGHPLHAGAAVVLRTRIDPDALGRLYYALEEAERAAEELLTDQAEFTDVPLARICKEAAAALKLDGAGAG